MIERIKISKEDILQNYWLATYITIGSPEIIDFSVDILRNLPKFK